MLLDVLQFVLVEVSQQEVEAAMEYTEAKDAPIIAAAIEGQCEYLLIFDRKHLINPPEVREKSRLKIVTPGDLLQILREQA